MYIDGKFNFDLTNEMLERNADLLAKFRGIYCAIGGLILPVKGVVPKQIKFEIKNRGWLNKDLSSRRNTKKTEKRNKDGSITRIIESTYTRQDGVRVRETNEVTYDNNNDFTLATGQPNPFESLTTLFDKLTPVNRGSHTVTITDISPKQFPREVVRKTVSRPAQATREDVVVETKIYDPIDTSKKGDVETARRSFVTKKQSYSTQPKIFAKPIIKNAITGFQWVIRVAPSDAPFDFNWWNDEMNSTSSSDFSSASNPIGISETTEEEVELNPNNNTKTTTRYFVREDADGNVTKEAVKTTEPLIDPVSVAEQRINDGGKEETTTLGFGPLRTETTSKTYNPKGVLLREVKTTSVRQPTVEETTTEETSSDGTKTFRSSITATDSNGITTTQETERTTKNGSTVNTTRSDSIDYDNGTRTVTFSKQVTDENGKSRTEEKVFRYSLGLSYNTLELIEESFEDFLVNEIVYGQLINEFELTGEYLDGCTARMLEDKYFEHQQAWAMHELLTQQLELGERISPALRKKLHEEQVRIFSGNIGNKVRDGFVLDRMSLTIFKEDFDLGCVFAPQNGLRIQWVAGTDRIYSWSIVVQVYTNVVRGSDVVTMEGWEDLTNKNIPRVPGEYNRGE